MRRHAKPPWSTPKCNLPPCLVCRHSFASLAKSNSFPCLVHEHPPHLPNPQDCRLVQPWVPQTTQTCAPKGTAPAPILNSSGSLGFVCHSTFPAPRTPLAAGSLTRHCTLTCRRRWIALHTGSALQPCLWSMDACDSWHCHSALTLTCTPSPVGRQPSLRKGSRHAATTLLAAWRWLQAQILALDSRLRTRVAINKAAAMHQLPASKSWRTCLRNAHLDRCR